MKTLIVYLYKENEDTKKNLSFFLKHGSHNNVNADYHLIINDHKHTLDIPNFINIHGQENALDFPSYKTLLKKIDYSDYSYIYFINSSCVGPFLPIYCKNYWYEYLNSILNEYDLVGPVIEMPPRHKDFTHNPFVHTYMFGLNKNTIQLFTDLLNKYDNLDKDTCIYFERLLSYTVLQAGFKIGSLLTLFKNVDINNPKNWHSFIWSNSDLTCYEIPNNYYGIDLNPYELIFIKNIRNPHEHRSIDRSGISDNLRKQIDNYVNWTNNKRGA
jgi:hypothetical protein